MTIDSEYNNSSKILSKYNRLEKDPRRHIEKEDEETYWQWMDEAIEVETSMIRCYVNQYINFDDLPDFMRKILVDYGYTTEEKQSMVVELKKFAQDSPN